LQQRSNAPIWLPDIRYETQSAGDIRRFFCVDAPKTQRSTERDHTPALAAMPQLRHIPHHVWFRIMILGQRLAYALPRPAFETGQKPMNNARR
jgi:hypothetical protein